MRYYLTALIGLAVFLGAAEVPRAQEPAPAQGDQSYLVVVNDDTIYVSDMDKVFMDIHSRMDNEHKESYDYRKLLNKIINDRLIAQEAFALGLDQDEALLEKLDRDRRENAVRLYARENFNSDSEISDKDILAYFLKNYSKMQIRTVSVQDSATAQTLINAIKGGASMDSIAEASSMDMYRYKGGLHNLKYYGDVEKELRDQADKMKPGEISAPFRYRQIYAFLRIDKTAPADTSELAAYTPKIKSVLMQQKREKKWSEFIAGLMKKYPFKTDSTILKRIEADAAGLYTPDFTNGSEDPVFVGSKEYSYTEGDLRTMISRLAMERGDLTFDSLMQIGMSSAKDKFVLTMAACENGYLDRPEIIAQYTNSLDSSLIEIYIKETVVSQITFNHAEFDAYYKEHLDDFREPDEYELERLDITDEKIATEIEKRLGEGADFDFIAREYEPDSGVSKEKAQWMSLMVFPDQIRSEMQQLGVGHSSRAYPTGSGWMIFHINGKRPGRVKEMDEVEMKIREVMFQKKFNELLDKALTLIKAGSTIEYNDPAIEKYFGEGS
ncbi:MAG: peptidyl-prolyl cis-trans isomerase [Candidatus Zixiibacteriota bacterium]